MTQIELLADTLKTKLPNISKLVEYQAFVKEITICNRSGNNTIACNMHHVKFFEFCKKNNIKLSNNLKLSLKNVLNIGFDLDSLYSNNNRIYVDRKSMVLNIIWKTAEQYPAELIDCSLLANQIKQNDISLKEKNKEVLDQIHADAVSVEYPVILTQDSLGTYGIIDGIHRIKQQQKQGKNKVLAHVIPMQKFHELQQNFINECLSDSSFINGLFYSTYKNIKNNILINNQQVGNDLTIESLQSLAFYYNQESDSVDVWKLYFKNKTLLVQQKFKSTGDHIGSYIETRSNDSRCYNDNLEIVELLSKFTLVSSRRMDIDQTYLGIRI